MLSKIWKSAVKALVGLLFMTPLSMELALAKPSTPSSTPNFFDFSATDIRGKKVHFSQYRGKVVLVVNTASECGFTPQLKDLEELYKKYSAKGFTVLAFPSNDFKQEKGNADEVRTFAQKEYGISFPLYEKSNVSGDNKLPVFKFLIEQKPGILFKEVQWNFEKFLISRNGKVLERWSSVTSPTSKSIVQKIETALNDPM